jgi:hypothetical protein
MKQLERRQIVLFGILGLLLVAALLYKFVLSGGDDGGSTVEQPVTQTTVATAQGTEDPATAAVPTDPQATDPQATAENPVAVDTPFDPRAYRDPFAPVG